MRLVTLFFLLLFFTYLSNSQEITQVVRGQVTDADMGTPLQGVKIKITSLNPVLGAISDKDGKFRIKNVPVGRHAVEVSSVGFEKLILRDQLVISGKEYVLNIQLKESSIVTDEIVVTGNANTINANNTLITSSITNLQPETINRYAGTRSDPAKMAATSAGVAGDNNQRNDIIIRGNSPISVLWRVDEVDVPNPNHFTVAATGGGIFAILNNNLLSNCDFITGAFPAEYGNSTSGVFDVHLRNGNNEIRENTFQIGLNGIELGTEGPFSKESGASYLANFRFVSLRPLTELGLDLSANVVPEYLDGTFKINMPTSNIGTFTLWGIGGYSKASVKNSDDDDIDWDLQEKVEDDAIRSRMFALGFSHTYLFGDNTFGKLILATTGSIINTNNEYVWENDSTMETEDFDATEGKHQIK